MFTQDEICTHHFITVVCLKEKQLHYISTTYFFETKTNKILKGENR